MGWLGLLFGLNLSFISSDVLINVLNNNADENRYIPQKQDTMLVLEQIMAFIHIFLALDNVYHTSCRGSANFSHVIPSTSGRETELTSEDEVARLLKCSDHYTALGFNRFQNVDVSVLKKEYRKRVNSFYVCSLL